MAQDMDFSNPLFIITAFIGVLISALAVMVKILQGFATAGFLGGVISTLGLGFVFFKIMWGKD